MVHMVGLSVRTGSCGPTFKSPRSIGWERHVENDGECEMKLDWMQDDGSDERHLMESWCRRCLFEQYMAILIELRLLDLACPLFWFFFFVFDLQCFSHLLCTTL